MSYDSNNHLNFMGYKAFNYGFLLAFVKITRCIMDPHPLILKTERRKNYGTGS